MDREHFNFRSVKDGKFGCICKPCQKQYRAGHYQRNKAYYIEKAIKARSELRIRNRKLLWEYLSTHPCVDCGIANPLVLEFDHVREEGRRHIKNDHSKRVDNRHARDRKMRCSLR